MTRFRLVRAIARYRASSLATIAFRFISNWSKGHTPPDHL